MSSIHDKMQYTRANSERESRESLLSDEELHLRQPERKNKWRRLLFPSYILGTLLACFFAGLVGYSWQHDTDSLCTNHISEYCELLQLLF